MAFRRARAGTLPTCVDIGSPLGNGKRAKALVSAMPSTEATPAKKEKSDVEKALDYFNATEAIHGESHPETIVAARLLEQARAQQGQGQAVPHGKQSHSRRTGQVVLQAQ